MLKILVAFQKLFLSSLPSLDSYTPWTLAGPVAGGILMMFLLDGEFNIPILIAVISVWMVNRNLNGDQRLFDLVPVSKKFTLLNVYLASVTIVVSGIIALAWFGLTIAFIMMAVTSIRQPQSIEQLLPVSFVPSVNIQHSVFIFLLVVIILFMGTTISFIRNSMFRNVGYAIFFMFFYGLLSVLKSNMPASTDTGKVVFMESLSLMPRINEVLGGLSVAVILIVPLSIYVGYKLYMPPLSKVS